jgi:hypothetical protein
MAGYRTDGSDGGAAFPMPASEGVHFETYGMTLRDYIAIKAMAAMISTSAVPVTVGGLSGAKSNYAAGAYMMADAMLKERNT